MVYDNGPSQWEARAAFGLLITPCPSDPLVLFHVLRLEGDCREESLSPPATEGPTCATFKGRGGRGIEELHEVAIGVCGKEGAILQRAAQSTAGTLTTKGCYTQEELERESNGRTQADECSSERRPCCN